MIASHRRLLIAILAWPAGILFTVGWTLLGADPAPCAPGEVCALALEAVSVNDLVEFLTFALGPGIVATWYWWRNGRGEKDARRPAGDPEV
jgi:hypothetical protein